MFPDALSGPGILIEGHALRLSSWSASLQPPSWVPGFLGKQEGARPVLGVRSGS